jgi:tetratricopeptide (TPR) repeat protein
LRFRRSSPCRMRQRDGAVPGCRDGDSPGWVRDRHVYYAIRRVIIGPCGLQYWRWRVQAVIRWKGVFPGVLFVLALLVAPALAEWKDDSRPQTAAKAPDGGKQDGAKPPDSRMQAEAHYELGVMYHERVFESLDLAIAEYEKAVKAKPDYAEAHYNLALSYHTKAKLGTDEKALYRKAVAEYKLYLKFSPQGELADKAKQNIRALEARLRQ